MLAELSATIRPPRLTSSHGTCRLWSNWAGSLAGSGARASPSKVAFVLEAANSPFDRWSVTLAPVLGHLELFLMNIAAAAVAAMYIALATVVLRLQCLL